MTHAMRRVRNTSTLPCTRWGVAWCANGSSEAPLQDGLRMDTMTNIEAVFNEAFAAWDIRLPEAAIAGKLRGKIVKAGWAIWYLFGSNEHGEYLDYYAAHRMTNDSHVRIFANGRCESLETLACMRVCSEDPEQEEQSKTEFAASNRRIAAMLEDKGFGLDGNEPGGVQINRYLLLKPNDADDA